MNDPFGDMDRQLDTDGFRAKVGSFVKAVRAKDGATVGKMRREDPRLEPIFDFIHYYDAATRTPQDTVVMETIALKTPGIAKMYNVGKLKALLMGKGRSRRRTGRARRGRGRRSKTSRRSSP